jgi:hypothetical protein
MTQKNLDTIVSKRPSKILEGYCVREQLELMSWATV